MDLGSHFTFTVLSLQVLRYHSKEQNEKFKKKRRLSLNRCETEIYVSRG